MLTLEDMVRGAKGYKMNPTERRAQRISLIMGLRSDSSTLTREKVVEMLDEREGCGDLSASAA